jgi:hypothetical protein
MSKDIGFIILSHANPGQLRRLVLALRQNYESPPIVCHHDFSQCNLSASDFPENVTFVVPSITTRWGRISVVDAALRALRRLFEISQPDWFFLLSGADYPVMRGDVVRAELRANTCDALLDLREVVNPPFSSRPPLPDNPALEHFVSPGNVEIAWHRYVGMNLWIPRIVRGPRLARQMFYPKMRALTSPFNADYRCFYGDHWFAGNARVAEILLRTTRQDEKLHRHLAWRAVPEECYYHTILANAGARIDKKTRRFAVWNGGGAHPQNLGIGDLGKIFKSKAYFARKFLPNADVLDEIDRALR